MLLRSILVVASIIAWSPPLLAMGAGGSGSLSGPSGSSPSDQLRQQYKKAVKAIENKDFSSAEILLADYVTKRKKSADAWNYLAYAQRNLGKHEDSMANYLRALDIDPKHKGALEYQGELFLVLSNVDGAMANLEKLKKVCRKTCEERDVLQASIERAKDGKTSWHAPGEAHQTGL